MATLAAHSDANDTEAKLRTAISQYETLLVAVKSKHPDFGFLLVRELVLQQAECWLGLARVKRLAWPLPQQQRNPWKGCAATTTQSVRECLQHARHLFFDTELPGKSKSVLQGQVDVLVEEAELLRMSGQPTQAMATLDEAIQLCFKMGDHANEGLVMDKLRALRLEVDTWSRLDELANDPLENASEKQILEQCFRRLASGNGVLQKHQLRQLAQELGVRAQLQGDEMDEMWQQIHAFNATKEHAETLDEGSCGDIDFQAVWRWWMAEEMFVFRKNHQHQQQQQHSVPRC